MKYVIGIDLGTSSLKTILFDQKGNKIAAASQEYPMSQPQNGWAEQNPEDWFQAAVKTLRQIAAESKISKESIVSIGISGQMHGLVMLNREGKVLRPCILWCDQRTESECQELTNLVGKERLIELTANPALTGFTASKILWVRRHEPEIFAQCRHILLPKDYLRYRLTGAFATDASDASGMQLFNVAQRKWSKEMADAVGIPMTYLPKVYESPEITGFLQKEIADLTGLSIGTCVVAGAGDNAAAAVGTGVIEQGRAFTTIGTSGVVYAHTKKPVIDRQGRFHTFCCAVPGEWHIMGVTQGAGLSLQWFRNQFCQSEAKTAEDTGTSVYKIMDEEAGAIPAGSQRLIFLPYLMGERTPHLDPNCRGMFFGLSALHTRPHCIRAVMEGVAYSLYDCLLVMQENKLSPQIMTIAGGGGKSDLWKQIICDVFSLPVNNATESEAPALGVAILAAVGAGIYDSVSEACDAMLRLSEDCIYPISRNTEKYRSVHSVYRSLYPLLKDTFVSLSKL